MNRSCLSLFFALSLMLLCQTMCPVLANAPATAKIVFSSTLDGNAEIYMMNPDGSQRVRLTNHPRRDSAPAWSPTGEQIVFNSNRDGKWDIYIMDADGTNVRRVFKTLEHREYPTWSPDGTQIAFSLTQAINPGSYQLQLANPQTGDRETIHPEPWLRMDDSAWSPNGDQIAFAHHRGSNFHADWFDPRVLPVQPTKQTLTTTWAEVKKK